MAPKKYSDRKGSKNSDASGELTGIIFIFISAFLLLCMVMGSFIFGGAIFNFMLSLFGFSSYPILLFILILGIFKVQKRRLSVPRRYAVAAGITALMVVMTVHLATSLSYLTDKGFTHYISEVYGNRNTGGGIVFGTLVYGFQAVFKTVFSFVLYGLVIVGSIFFASDFFRNLYENSGKAGGGRPRPAKQDARVQTGWTEDRYGYNGGMTVYTPTAERGLFIDNIIPAEPTVRVSGGQFDDLPDKKVKQKPDSGHAGMGYSSAYGDNEQKQRAKKILFEENTAYFDKFLPQKAKAEPIIKKAEPPVPEVAVPAPKDFERYYNPGEIINGDSVSDILAKELGLDERPPAVRQSEPIRAAGVASAEPELRPADNPRPIVNGDAYSAGKRGLSYDRAEQPPAPPAEPEQPRPRGFDYAMLAPILNGDRYTRAPEKPTPPPVSPTASVSRPPEPPTPPLDPPARPPTPPLYPPAHAAEPAEAPAEELEADGFDDLYSAPAYRKRTERESAFPDDRTDRAEALREPFEDFLSRDMSAEPDFTADTADILAEDEDDYLPGSLSGGGADDFWVGQPKDDDGVSEGIAIGDIIVGDYYTGEADEPTAAEAPERADDSYFALDETLEDKSEYGFTNPHDTTGYYTHIDAFGEPVSDNGFDSRVEDIEQRFKPAAKMNLSERQIDIDSYKKTTPKPESKPKVKKAYKYTRPPIELLVTESSLPDEDEEESRKQIEILENTFEVLNFPAEVANVIKGPAVTKYELTVPPGTSVKRIAGLSQDISYNLASSGRIRIEAPIPGKRAIGIEVPNKKVGVVGLKDIIDSPEFRAKKSPLTVALGKDIQGNIIVDTIENLIHLLIAGTTGSGKSACLNCILISLLYKSSPEDVRLILIDPKMVGFASYKALPHMLIDKPIIDAGQAINAFKWLRGEMERRYKILQHYAMEKIQEFNNSTYVKEGVEPKLPYIVMIVDEYGDLMVSSAADKRNLEDIIMSIASKARAAGIHLIFATQRPSRDVVTGTIKANLPSRIACKVSSSTESRIILDSNGAETLVGRGDMLFSPASESEETRVQGAYITNAEVKDIINFIKENNVADFDAEFEEAIIVKEAAKEGEEEDDEDELYDRELIDVVRCVMKSGIASSSLVQRRFRFGWNKAARIMEQMEQLKFISPQNGTKPREVYITKERFLEFFGEDYE
ncbi:MAG: DNA translocase FtsK [Clostridiales bacterium]|nr:DNA translocase FtsK [Clostridiales bacterium]